MKDNVLHKVAKIIADRYDVEPEYIFQNTRQRKITDIRAIFHYMSTDTLTKGCKGLENLVN